MMRRLRLARRWRSVRRDRASVVEQMERRVLLTASVSGTVFNDWDGSGTILQGFALANWRVYADLNHNGSYDSGEPTALSDANGHYAISGLAAGSYTLRDVVQSGYYPSIPSSGSLAVTLADGQSLASQNFGNGQFASISWTTFNDQNGDGIRQASEPVKSGVTLFIDANDNGVLDPGETSVTSNASGFYSFTGLRYGNVTVRQVVPAGWQASTSATEGYGIESGVTYTADLGFTQESVLAGTVYTDDNRDAQVEGTDGRLAGITVYLDLNNTGQFDSGEPSTLSKPNSGWYQFGAPPGTYTLREVIPSGYALDQPAAGSYSVTLGTLDWQGGLDFGHIPATSSGPATVSGTVFNDLSGNGTNYGAGFALSGWRVYADTNNNGQYDSGEPTAFTSSAGFYTISGLTPGSYTIRDVVQSSWYASTPSTGSRSVTLTGGQVLSGQDFGNAQYGSISGTIFNDQNGNGTRDAGEPALPGFRVFMDLNNDFVFDSGDLSATADSNGHYAFNNLKIGHDTLLAMPTAGWVSDGVTAAGFQVDSGANFSQDWPFTQKAVVRGIVFADNDNNGAFTSGDTGLAGWTVYADLNNNGALDSGEPSTVTDANGLYQFGLSPGTYTIREVAQNGYHASAPAAGSYTITAAAATVYGGENFANVLPSSPASISGTVYNDLDGTGTLQASYNRLANWRVYLDTNNNGQYDTGEPTAVTDSSGIYTISGVTPGSYALRDVVASGWYATAPASGSRAISPGWGQSLTGQNFYNAQYGSVSGTIYNDLNGSGTYEPGDPVLPGFQLFMDLNHDFVYDSGDVVATSDSSGHYTFTNLRIGDYNVFPVPVSGWLDAGVTEFGCTVSSGFNFSQDWTFTQEAVVRGFVFADNDNNGTYTPGDTSFGGWTVYADVNNNGVFDPGEPNVISQNNGVYQLGLSPGTYSIREVPQGGFLPTVPAGGSYTVIAPAATLFDEENFANVQAAAPAPISGSVYNDVNHNGVWDPGEPGLAGRVVYLDANDNGHLDPGEISTTTDSAGSYLFQSVAPGTTTLREVLPSGWVRTAPLAGSLVVSHFSGQPAAGPVFGDVQISTVPMDFNYLLTLAQHYGQQGTFAAGDLNGDGQVNFNDLLILAQSYGHSLPSAAAGNSLEDVASLRPRRSTPWIWHPPQFPNH